MQKKQKQLLSFLAKQKHDHWITATELAKVFNVTSRTIRNWIFQINEALAGLIQSSSRGYLLNRQQYHHYLNKSPYYLNEDGDREDLILFELLKSSASGIDLFDLSEMFYISESTLQNDLQVIQKNLPTEELRIKLRDYRVILEGSEAYKRKYMISMIYDKEGNQSDLSQLTANILKETSLEEIRAIITQVLDKHSIRMNDYLLENIVLHFAISIERFKEGNAIFGQDQDLELGSELELALVLTEEILEIISQRYQLDFPAVELAHLSLQFAGLKEGSHQAGTEEILDSYVSSEIHEVVKATIAETEQMYRLNLDDQDFLSRLLIHVQGLYNRSVLGQFTRNSSLLDIKINYPIIYDISVFIAARIQSQLEIDFTEDEIAFIALHVGTLLHKNNHRIPPIQVGLYSRDYSNLQDFLLSEVTEIAGDDCRVRLLESKQLAANDFDLVITSDPSLDLANHHSLLVQPLLTERNKRAIQKALNDIRLNLKHDYYHFLLDQYMKKEIFLSQNGLSFSQAEEVIAYMVAALEDNGYADKQYYQGVKRREELSATSFPSRIAVPHSIELNGLKSGIAILILPEPLMWENIEVDLVAMVVINQSEVQEFNDFFEKFIEIVSEDYQVARLVKAENHSDFVRQLKDMLDQII